MNSFYLIFYTFSSLCNLLILPVVNSSLYEYSDVDVQFVDEGQVGQSCGLGRGCISCEKPSMSKSTWDWCATRVMSPRMALRLKRLAVLVKTDTMVKGTSINDVNDYLTISM